MTIVQSIFDLKTYRVYKWLLKDDGSIVYEDIGARLYTDDGFGYKSETPLTWYTNDEVKLKLKDNQLSPTKITLPKSTHSSLIHVVQVHSKYKYADDYSDPWGKMQDELIEKYGSYSLLNNMIPLSKYEVLLKALQIEMRDLIANIGTKWHNVQIFDMEKGEISEGVIQAIPKYNPNGYVIPFMQYTRVEGYYRFKLRESIEDMGLSPYVVIDRPNPYVIILDEATMLEPGV